MAHIEKEKLEQLYRGELPFEEQIEMLEHIGSCDYCAAAFAVVTEEQELFKAPTNLKSSILHEAQTIPVQFQTKQRVLSKQLQLMLYSLKISTAAVCTIIMMFAICNPAFTPNFRSDHKQLPDLVQTTDNFTDSINTFTDQLLHGEVLKHD